MSSGIEERFLARAHDLDGAAEDLAETIAGIRARGGATALAREVLAGLQSAARALADSTMVPAPAALTRARRYATSEEFLNAVGDAEDEVTAAAGQAARLRSEVLATLAGARAALARAYTMPARTPEERAAREAAIADAQTRIRTCETALAVLDGLRDRYAGALRQLRRVPGALGWVYAAIYDMRRRGHQLPGDAREWFGAAGATA